MRGSHESMNQTRTLEVLHLDGFGTGAVTPTEKYTDEQVAREITRTQEPIQDPGIGCIDERHAANGPEPVRRKTAGGVGMSGFEGAILGNWYMLGDDVLREGAANEIFDMVAEEMVARGIVLVAHTDNHAAEGSTSCGAMDGAAAGNARLAEIGATELKPIVATLLGSDFDEEIYADIVSQAQRLEEVQFFKDWDSVAAQRTVARLGGVIETLDAQDVIVGDGSDEKRHGHGAEAIHHNTDPSKSNNRDQTNIRYFQLDKSGASEAPNILGRNEHERRVMVHGVYAYNVAIAYGLTSNQRFAQS